MATPNYVRPMDLHAHTQDCVGKCLPVYAAADYEALVAALTAAEAALADIGDSEGPPGLTVEWCEGRVYRVLPTIRAALLSARKSEVTK